METAMLQKQVDVSISAKYNKQYNRYTPMIRRVLDEVFEDIAKELGIDQIDTTIVFKIHPIREKNCHGRATFIMKRFVEIELDCRARSERAIANTIAHEMKHAQQYLQGRLSNEFVLTDKLNKWGTRSYGWQSRFKQLDGTEVIIADTHKANYTKYRNLPWEVEAFNYGDDYSDRYMQGKQKICPINAQDLVMPLHSVIHRAFHSVV